MVDDFWTWLAVGQDFQMYHNGAALPVFVRRNPHGWNDYAGRSVKYGRGTARPWAAEVHGVLLKGSRGMTVTTYMYPEAAMTAARRTMQEKSGRKPRYLYDAKQTRAADRRGGSE